MLLLRQIYGMTNMLWRWLWFLPWVKKWYWLWIVLGAICLDRKLNRLKIAWKRISMHGPPSAPAAKCTSPRKVHGLQSARTALWVHGTPSARTHTKCIGRSSIGRAALSARATIVWRGEWAALPTHTSCNAHAMQPRYHSRGLQWAAIAWHVKD